MAGPGRPPTTCRNSTSCLRRHRACASGRRARRSCEQIIAAGGRRGEIYRAARDLRDRYGDDPRALPADPAPRLRLQPRPPAAGEQLQRRPRPGRHARAPASTVLEATLRLVHSPPCRVDSGARLPRRVPCRRHVMQIRELSRSALEGIDEHCSTTCAQACMPRTIAAAARRQRLAARRVRRRHQGGGRRARPKRCMRPLKRDHDVADAEADRGRGGAEADLGGARGRARRHRPGPGQAGHLGRLGGLGRAARARSATTCANSTSCSKRYGYESALYGHFGQGCIHCRIDFDLRRPSRRRATAASLSRRRPTWSCRYGGSLSGEHGDGQSKAELLPQDVRRRS